MESANDFCFEDIQRIAAFLVGDNIVTATSDFVMPSVISIDEQKLYEICVDLNIDMTFVVEADSALKATELLLLQLLSESKISSFVDYIVGRYIDTKILQLTEAGYEPYLIKSEIVRKINSLWSIDGQEFIYGSNGVALSSNVRFKEFNRLGTGGFASIYKGDRGNVYKVLSQMEKASVSSVHRFKREYEIMQKHNDSGYTIRVSNYEPQNLVYQMEQALTSLEDYLASKKVSEQERDDIIIRCAECMAYLHANQVIHRDFHPGNILLNQDGNWVVTDFGLAKSFAEKFSYVTMSTRAVGRAWFTDPIQLAGLKDGSFSTDIYSLAKTIDFIWNGDMSQRPNKFTTITNKATAHDLGIRYGNICEMIDDIRRVIQRDIYKSPQEIITELINGYERTNKFDMVELSAILQGDIDGQLIWQLVMNLKNRFVDPFVLLCRTDYELAEVEIARLYTYTSETYYIAWSNYDKVAEWAISVLRKRKDADDAISQKAAEIISYVASSVQRYDIQDKAAALKNTQDINPHIRAMLPDNR